MLPALQYTVDRMICSGQFQTILASFKLGREKFWLKNI